MRHGGSSPSSPPTPLLVRMHPDLYDHRLVDRSVQALKFDAAASYQLPSSHNASCGHSKEAENLLVVSPYTERAHLLDLNTLDKPDQLLAKALTVMKPIRNDYATAPYIEAFNWDRVIETLRDLAAVEEHDWQHRPFYIVVFRSQSPPTTDRSYLGLLDESSHKEAVESGGLLKYWYGVPDPVNGRNLATCVWRRRDDARRGSAGEGHRRAALAARQMYTEWKIERLALVIRDGVETWDIVDWDSLPS
ncbi:hypothetical protein FGG08_000887 [Glutinoglossum americanum]|uniref:Uncharacterized protein n=1 Tax=Glutinoglossum americanum TaxID=1670608 RepID=A0A9P8L3A5_9PEZI|nr:hypothetical protein FGG08_000887 [Glutinoglossum americanum]